MTKLLIVADDFTGALDTGVQFATLGIATRVMLYSKGALTECLADAEVLVINAETRHLQPEQAYSEVYAIIHEARKAGITNFYKKTDSALRGNVGSELAAALEATGEARLHFIPAFPKMARTTLGGIHYIDGVPVAESVFAQDLINPVIYSDVLALLASQSEIPIYSVAVNKTLHQNGIGVYDCSTEEELCAIAESFSQDVPVLFAGCAGFAAMLPDLLGLTKRNRERPALHLPLIVACGSVNPITLAQIDYAEQQGATRIRLSAEQKLAKNYFRTEQGRSDILSFLQKVEHKRLCIFDTDTPDGNAESCKYANDHNINPNEFRFKITDALGLLISEYSQNYEKPTLLITGGDTLLGFMHQIGCTELIPICELMPGVVLSQVQTASRCQYVISKSGGFGEKTLLLDLVNDYLLP